MKIIFWSIAAAIAILMSFASPAHAQERSAVKQGFELEANSGKRILVFRPAVSVGSQSTGGMFEPNADWTEQAKSNIQVALEELQARLGNEVVEAPEAFGEDARTDLLAWGVLLASMSPSYDARRTYESLEISVYGNLYRYGRDHEREADLLGLGYLNRSTLAPQAASNVWQNLMGEMEASAVARGLKKPKFNAIAFTASHPPTSERATYLAALAAPEGAGRDYGAERYQEALSAWLPVFLEDQIKLNDFGGSEYIIDNLAKDGWTAQLWHARGELYRTRGNQRDLVNAVEFYSNAIALDDSLAAAHRGLGLSLFKTGERTRAQRELARYLELAPNADDAKMIGMMLPKEPFQ